MIRNLISRFGKNKKFVEQSSFTFSSKNQKAFKYISNKPIYELETCFKLARAHDNSAFDQTISMTLILTANPLKGEQMIRGTAVLPHGKGKSFKIAVFTDPEYHDMIQEANADIILTAEDVKNVDLHLFQMKRENINFDKLLSTPESLPTLKSLGRLLGPLGLMPNIKDQTLVEPENLGFPSVIQSSQSKNSNSEKSISEWTKPEL